MSHKLRIGLLSALLLLLLTIPAYAQRATPTNISQINGNGGDDDDDNEDRGTIQGLVYRDVNGDGQCVNTGVEGEDPIEGVNIEFVSSDEATVITLYSGPEGIYGLFAAGQSYWRVTAKPGPEWVVTSENPLYAPIYSGSDVQTGINFCVQKGTNARVILPASGAPAATSLSWLALVGLLLTLLGIGLHFKEQRS